MTPLVILISLMSLYTRRIRENQHLEKAGHAL